MCRAIARAHHHGDGPRKVGPLEAPGAALQWGPVFDGEIMGKPWENHGKTMGKYGKIWENMGKYWKILENMGMSWDLELIYNSKNYGLW